MLHVGNESGENLLFKKKCGINPFYKSLVLALKKNPDFQILVLLQARYTSSFFVVVVCLALVTISHKKKALHL